MKVGLMGFGKAGRAVASVLLESKETHLQLVMRSSNQLFHRSAPEFLGMASDDPGLIYPAEAFAIDDLLDQHPVDAIIDFSSKDGLNYYGKAAAKRRIIIVSAVSQYEQTQVDYLKSLAQYTTAMHSPNITLGINFLILAAKVLKNIAPYTDIEVLEEHFKDKPEVSGTARVIANHLEVDTDNIKTIRAGGIIGTHEIMFGFPYQTVRLRHESISREAFGNGILFAISQLKYKDKGFYTMEDLMYPYFNLSVQQ